MKVVLFNPRASDEMPFDGPPLSLLCAASLLDQKRIHIVILDSHERALIADQCRDADWFGVTAMTGYQLVGAESAVRTARQSNPRIRTVAGGWHPSMIPGQMLTCIPELDFEVAGAGEAPLRDLVEGVIPPEAVSGVSSRDGGGIRTNSRERLVTGPMASIPLALIRDPGRYLVRSERGQRSAYLLTSQGCTGACTFCAEVAYFHRHWFRLPLDLIARQVAFWRDLGADSFALADSNSLVSRDHALALADLMAGTRWGGATGRLDNIKRWDDSLWKRLADSGLNDMFIGVESIDNEVLKTIGKNCQIEELWPVVRRIRTHGIRVQVPFILGMPCIEDPWKEYRQTMAFIGKHFDEADQFHAFTYTPYPGTAFLKQAADRGYRLPRDIWEWSRYDLHGALVPWMDRKLALRTKYLQICFIICAGHVRKVAGRVARFFERICRWRITHNCFLLPLDLWLVLLANRMQRRFAQKRVIF